MAVFLLNICKYNGCGITFPSLGDLIQHIEDTHIDYDPKVIEQKEQAQPACLPLSYVLRFISEDARKESPFLAGTATGVELKRKLAIKHHSYSMSSSNRSNTPTGSEMDEDEMIVSESEDSNDSWTTEEFSSEFIMRYGSRHSGSGANGAPGNEKPFACPVPGCKKRYKNVNGIKYHSKNGHKKDGKVRKGYKCHCGKSYKTAQGLKNHAMLTHNSSPDNVLTAQQLLNSTNNSSIIIQRSASPSQSLGSLSPSSISNMSSSASSCHGGGSATIPPPSGTTAASNVLQHLATNTLGNSAANIATNNGITFAANPNVNVITIQQQQQQHQQQQQQQHQQHTHVQQSAGAFNATAGSHQQLSTVVSSATEMPPSHAHAHAHGKREHFANGNSPNATTITSHPVANVKKPMRAVLIPSQQMTAAVVRNAVSPDPNGMRKISPTFIEHKYSADIVKERFFANIRHNQHQSGVLHKSNSKDEPSNDTGGNENSSMHATPLLDVIAGGGSNSSIGVGVGVGVGAAQLPPTHCGLQQQQQPLFNQSINIGLPQGKSIN